LKSTLINIILSQQIGYGFYKTATINPYTYIHCYLNIPDTSNRDSLFQAEARRCKEILDNIKDTKPTETTFCIFDELYSGTNPYEAVASAQAFLSHLSQQKNVSFMITTHYIELCNKLSEPNTKNYNMNIIKKTDSIEYTYLLREGISNIKGGVHVLEQLNYPENIISKTKENLSNSFIPG
jgi:DNA mismatch repair ATPase MutS